jgi:hypothetical protein
MIYATVISTLMLMVQMMLELGFGGSTTVVDASLMLQREYTSRHDTKQIGQQSSSSV